MGRFQPSPLTAMDLLQGRIPVQTWQACGSPLLHGSNAIKHRSHDFVIIHNDRITNPL